MTKPHLFSPFVIPHSSKPLELKNRIVMPPMDQYSAANDGKVNAWHFQHYVQRALGGVGLIIIEATAISKDAVISPQDLGLWEYSQVEGIAHIVEECHHLGAKVAIQLNHAGRKGAEGNPLIAPSAIPFTGNATPREMTGQDLQNVKNAFVKAAIRAVSTKVDAIEIHAAHGYLLSSFLSPLSNKRRDDYGLDKARFLQEILESIKDAINDEIPIILRISANDWAIGGNEAIDMAGLLAPLNDLYEAIDVSSGGVIAEANIPAYPCYQIHLAHTLKLALGKPTIGGGFVCDAKTANHIVKSGASDCVYLGRELLKNPFFALQASQELGVSIDIPKAYQRALK
ncbi:hypothetical protein CCZ01_01095 [Helicobacter monodelphidis]|uniref:oxidoreductase n=1 Tax=Helicobacter sp. 15-1451 TaxID=2004995 RepID=UPI000DCEDBCC|nr:NADPH dehydrogenase [Helicobacter sp. 15-1451]RAX58822.1 hypothetical protein CCZ01_01095 [Helicobacter sp. 15-1451]